MLTGGNAGGRRRSGGPSWVVGGMGKAKVGVGGRREGCGPGLNGQNTPGLSYTSHALAPLQRTSRPTGGLGEPPTAAGSIVRVLVRLLDAFSGPYLP